MAVACKFWRCVKRILLTYQLKCMGSQFRMFVFVLFATSCIMTASLAFLFSRAGKDKIWLATDHGLLDWPRTDTRAAESYLSVREAQTSAPGSWLDTASAVDTTVYHNDIHVPWNSSHTEEDAIYEQRIQHLRDACQTVTNTSRNTSAMQPGPVGPLAKEVEKHFFGSPVHRLVYCSVQKVGSSFWKRAFRVLNSVEPPKSLFLQSGVKAHGGNTNIIFENKTSQWQRNQLSASLKFIFVRDPFARTFSGYVDKVFLPSFVFQVHLQESGSLYSFTNDEQKAENTCRLNVPTFAKFIRVQMSKTESLFIFNGHYTPIHTHCNPCTVPFDIVGKMESFQRDTEYILGKIGVRLSDIADDPNTFDTRSDLNIMRVIAWRILKSPVWKQMSNDNRCLHAKHELLSRMWTTFQVRGFLSASVRYPLTAKQSAEATLSDLMPTIENAYQSSEARAQRLQQRESAMVEAFRSVDLEDLKKLQAILQADCVLFDYDCSLDRFFNAHHGSPLPDYGFFKDW